jgi:hypothetical protein
MTTNLDLAKVVAAHVQIGTVALRKATVASAINPAAPPTELTLTQSHRATYKREGTSARLEVALDFHFLAVEERASESAVEAIKLEATYVLLYVVPEGQEYPDECLSAFAWLNGSYNVWPYWRELVQTVAGRVGLGSITIPVYRPKVVKLPAEKQLELAEGKPVEA